MKHFKDVLLFFCQGDCPLYKHLGLTISQFKNVNSLKHFPDSFANYIIYQSDNEKGDEVWDRPL